jgi:hypothetical protein
LKGGEIVKGKELEVKEWLNFLETQKIAYLLQNAIEALKKYDLPLEPIGLNKEVLDQIARTLPPEDQYEFAKWRLEGFHSNALSFIAQQLDVSPEEFLKEEKKQAKFDLAKFHRWRYLKDGLSQLIKSISSLFRRK